MIDYRAFFDFCVREARVEIGRGRAAMALVWIGIATYDSEAAGRRMVVRNWPSHLTRVPYS